MKRSLKIVLAVVVGLFGLFYYLTNYTEIPIAEVTCDKDKTLEFYLQVNEYAAITNLWGGPSDGNILVTFENGSKRSFIDIQILGKGNQRVALIRNERDWDRYVFGSKQIYFNGKAYQCVAN